MTGTLEQSCQYVGVEGSQDGRQVCLLSFSHTMNQVKVSAPDGRVPVISVMATAIWGESVVAGTTFTFGIAAPLSSVIAIKEKIS
jgi:hypothetical protein